MKEKIKILKEALIFVFYLITIINLTIYIFSHCEKWEIVIGAAIALLLILSDEISSRKKKEK